MRVARFLPMLVLGAACSHAATSVPVPMDDPAYSAPRELTADQQVAHVLNRLAFGARPGDVAAVRAVGVDVWIEQQLHPGSIADSTDARLFAAFPTTREPIEELLKDYPRPQQLLARSRQQMKDSSAAMNTAEDTAAFKKLQQQAQVVAQQAMATRIGRSTVSARQLEAVMTDFWLNHFSVFAGKGGPMRHYLAAYERDAIRPHALGKFRDLLGAVAVSPAMLWYLDQWQSVADSTRPTLQSPPRMQAMMQRRAAEGAMGPLVQQLARQRPKGVNENYARELLELHTLGVDGGYTQQDVMEVARALTGWTLDQPLQRGAFVFRAAQHDAGEKVILGTRLPAGRGIEDGQQVLDLLARHPATARFIATKLARRLVSDTPPAALIDRAAATFTQTDGDIAATVRTLVRSPEFFSRGAYRAKVKSPFELVVSTLRAVDAPLDTTPRLAALLARLGQPVYGHQAPNGWPETGTEWINAGSILNRINFGVALAAGRVPSAAPLGWPGAEALRTAPRAEQVDAVVQRFLNGEISSDMRQVLVSGDHPMLGAPAAREAAATDAMADAMPRPMLRNTSGLAQIVGLTIGSPEFQRR